MQRLFWFCGHLSIKLVATVDGARKPVFLDVVGSKNSPNLLLALTTDSQDGRLASSDDRAAVIACVEVRTVTLERCAEYAARGDLAGGC